MTHYSDCSSSAKFQFVSGATFLIQDFCMMSTPCSMHLGEAGTRSSETRSSNVPDSDAHNTPDQMRLVLAEVQAMRRENALLKKTVTDLKRSNTRKKLFKQEVQPECSVSVFNCSIFRISLYLSGRDNSPMLVFIFMKFLCKTLCESFDLGTKLGRQSP